MLKKMDQLAQIWSLKRVKTLGLIYQSSDIKRAIYFESTHKMSRSYHQMYATYGQ